MSELTTAPSMRPYLEMTLANVAYLDAADAVKPATAPGYEPARYYTALATNDDNLVVILSSFIPPNPLHVILNNHIASTTSIPPWEATSTVSILLLLSLLHILCLLFVHRHMPLTVKETVTGSSDKMFHKKQRVF